MPRAKADPDPRFIPFRDWAYQTFYDERGVHLILGKNNLGPLQIMLNKTKAFPEYSIDHLKIYWLCFIRSVDKFHQRVPNPLRFFCANVEVFASQVVKQGEGSRDIARAFVAKNIGGGK